MQSEAVIIKDFSQLSGNLGMLGGSFDPVHNAHLAMAQAVKQHFNLDYIVFVPTFRNPLKSEPHASPQQRLEMLQLAIAQEKNYLVSSFEIDHETLYSFDTVCAILAQAAQGTEIFLLHGSDCLEQLHKWHKVDELLDLVNFVIVDRAGELPAQPLSVPGIEARQLSKLARFQLAIELPEISASVIRKQISMGQVPTNFLPSAVAGYIEAQRLYLEPLG